MLGPSWTKNEKNASQNCVDFSILSWMPLGSIFGWIFDRFWGPCWVDFSFLGAWMLDSGNKRFLKDVLGETLIFDFMLKCKIIEKMLPEA